MKHILEGLEESRSLVEKRSGGGLLAPGEVVVGELEYALFQAAEIFSQGIDRDPTEVTYQSWYTAMIAGSLLLCSGNCIGSGSHVHPSYSVGGHNVFDGFLGSESASHEIRRKLPKFQELRVEVARAVKLMIRLAAHQNSSRSWRAVASFLEWKEVVALMLGPEAIDDSALCGEICELHKAHIIKAATIDNDAYSHSQLQDDKFDRDTRLSSLAGALEANPDDKAHWISLVAELGPIDLSQTHVQSPKWGENRIQWWDDVILAFPPDEPSFVAESDGSTFLSQTIRPDGADRFTTNSESNLSCLDIRVFDDEKEPSLEERMKEIDVLLPSRHCSKTFDSGAIRTIEELTQEMTEEKEVLCYKLVIRAHLYGPDAPFISGLRHVMTPSNFDAMLASSFLKRMGIYAAAFLPHASPNASRTKI